MKIYLVVTRNDDPAHGLPAGDVRRLIGKAFLVKTDLDRGAIGDAFGVSEGSHGAVVRVSEIYGWIDEETGHAVNDWMSSEDWEDRHLVSTVRTEPSAKPKV